MECKVEPFAESSFVQLKTFLQKGIRIHKQKSLSFFLRLTSPERWLQRQRQLS